MLSNCESTNSQYYVMYGAGVVFFYGSGSTTLLTSMDIFKSALNFVVLYGTGTGTHNGFIVKNIPVCRFFKTVFIHFFEDVRI